MHAQNKIASRRYHLRIYKACFVGTDAVDWLIQTRHAHTRDEAIASMRILQDHLVIHHVCDEHVFKDEYLFYRFRRDDDSYTCYKDLKSFYRGQCLSQRLHNKREVLRDIHANGQLYRSSFLGCDLVEWLVDNNEAFSREYAIKYCKKLMENDIIKHVTDDFRFRDDRLIYQFTIDFSQPYLLCDISRFRRTLSERSSSGTGSDTTDTGINQEISTSHSTISDDEFCTPCKPNIKDDVSNSEQKSDTHIQQPQSVLLRHMTAEELEDPDTPYVKHKVRVFCDSVGYGFVIRGEGPVYIQIVDPEGPAVAAGLKVRQYLHSVNGVNVLRKDHRTVAKMIIENPGFVNLVIMTHKRDTFS
ncbi:DEP domain-containing mTOR-interacting protein-like [Gigantopelta aegis]|uniref:DEP domain-containing mTOR-interacting protein-like n=1 Tax=Gigantopelta aegis TaxID=1735272 RepID=UPI001B88D602|nr:DEP domain-containing mTOR-interacting protein-like [Gigantopelta aegis]